MRTLFPGAILGWLAAAATLQAQVAPLPSPASPGIGSAPAAGTTSLVSDAAAFPDQTSPAPSTRLWSTGDYLLWWVNGNRLPPLITTSPAGTPPAAAGVLGTPGAEVLFGNTDVNDRARSGGRLTAGYWLDCEQKWGIEASFFMLESQSRGITPPVPAGTRSCPGRTSIRPPAGRMRNWWPFPESSAAASRRLRVPAPCWGPRHSSAGTCFRVPGVAAVVGFGWTGWPATGFSTWRNTCPSRKT
jgi:hypothetical protein